MTGKIWFARQSIHPSMTVKLYIAVSRRINKLLGLEKNLDQRFKCI
jgi:hypothetical protein